MRLPCLYRENLLTQFVFFGISMYKETFENTGWGSGGFRENLESKPFFQSASIFSFLGRP
jgi:hypothetical protein